MRSCTLALLAMLLPAAIPAAAQTVPLAPPGTAMTLRAYALGMMPMDGSFTRFRGQINLQPGRPGACSVELVADSASLAFSDQSVRDEVLSPTFLDAASFPTMAYRGSCAAGTLTGQLLLHGQTHPVTLALTGDGGRLVATGSIDRTEWGITGRRFTVGSSVRIQVTVPLPDAGRDLLPALLGSPAR